jgi:hypothetical protein
MRGRSPVYPFSKIFGRVNPGFSVAFSQNLNCVYKLVESLKLMHKLLTFMHKSYHSSS